MKPTNAIHWILAGALLFLSQGCFTGRSCDTICINGVELADCICHCDLGFSGVDCGTWDAEKFLGAWVLSPQCTDSTGTSTPPADTILVSQSYQSYNFEVRGLPGLDSVVATLDAGGRMFRLDWQMVGSASQHLLRGGGAMAVTDDAFDLQFAVYAGDSATVLMVCGGTAVR